MSWFGKPKDETPSEEDYDLNGLNEIHSRAKAFVKAEDYTAAHWMAEERKKYEQEHNLDVRWDRDTDTFERRRR